MSIAELQTLIINSVTMGTFFGFFIGALMVFFGKRY